MLNCLKVVWCFTLVDFANISKTKVILEKHLMPLDFFNYYRYPPSHPPPHGYGNHYIPPNYYMPPNGVGPPGMGGGGGGPHGGYSGAGRGGDPRYNHSSEWQREYPPDSYRRGGGGGGVPPAAGGAPNAPSADRRPPAPSQT